jgi:hypothetical protein
VRALLLFISVSAIAATAAASAVGSAPEPLSLSVNRSFAGEFWSASGAFTDSGTLADTPQHFTRTGTYHFLRTYTSSAGTFDTRGDAKITPTSTPGVFAVSGYWTVISGTGAYSDLHGTGTISETFDANAGTVVGTWDGLVHFD